MVSLWRQSRVIVAVIVAFSPSSAPAEICDTAAQIASKAVGVPLPILQAVMSVESDARPWTLNVDGADRRYTDALSALDALVASLSTARNIDVGCFQISSRHHAAAFRTPAQMLSPVPNAIYAAIYLRQLRETKGDWGSAVACYHSCTPERGIPYLGRVRQRLIHMME